MSNVKDTLYKRAAVYGDFYFQSKVSVDLRQFITKQLALRKKTLAHDQQEALDMICMKISRIINGCADNHDSWHDIAGYASLVADRLKKEGR